jgi:hypothetical protein
MKQSYARRFWRFLGWLIAATILVALFWAFANVAIVSWRAESLANGQPYCLQVEDEKYGLRYRSATSLWDLSGFKMWTPYRNAGGSSDFQLTFHAVLSIFPSDGRGIEWRNWSYRKQTFVPITLQTRMSLRSSQMYFPSCEPRIHFALSLPIM